MIYSAAIMARRLDHTIIVKTALTTAQSENEAAGKILRLCHQTFPIAQGWTDHQIQVGMSVEAFLQMFPDVKLES